MATLRFNGPEERWSELPVTGSQQMWLRGQVGPVADANVAAFLATGKFQRYERDPVYEQADQLIKPDGTALAAGGGASGFTKNASTGMAETDVGGETFVALPTDINGNARAIVIGRSGTLAGLVGLTANDGEIGVATDQPALVRFGATAESNVVFANEIRIDVGNITYVPESAGYGWFVGDGNVPSFNVPAGVRRVVLESTRPDKGVHADITATEALVLKIKLTEMVRNPEITVINACKLDVGGCQFIGINDVALAKIDVSSTAYWPPVIKAVVATLANPIYTLPTAPLAVTQAQAHALVV